MQWAIYLFNTKELLLAMRKCPARTGAAFFSNSPLLPKVGKSSAVAELTMATAAFKEAIAHRIQAAEPRQGPSEPTPLDLEAITVLHRTYANQVSMLGF